MKINQIPNSINAENSDITALAVAEFSASFPLADFAEFYSIVGNADSPRKVSSIIDAGDTRTISSDYTVKNGTPGFGAIALKIYGDKINTDAAYERRGIDIGSQRSMDVANFSRSLGRFFMDSLINDELSAETFSGLKEQIAALNKRNIFHSADGGSLPSGNAAADRKLQDEFIELLELQIALVRPTAIMANAYFLARLASIGRSYLSTVQVQDIYGVNRSIQTFGGVPLVNVGYASNGTGLIIPKNKAEGSSGNVCTSIFLARFGEQTDVTFATNVGLDVKNLGLVGTSYQTMVEFDVDMAVLDDTAVSEIAGIIL